MRTPYEILEIPPGSSVEVAKKAFRKMAHLHHPDKPTGNHAKFLEVKKAYEDIERGNVSSFDNDWNSTRTRWTVDEDEDVEDTMDWQTFVNQQQQQREQRRKDWYGATKQQEFDDAIKRFWENVAKRAEEEQRKRWKENQDQINKKVADDHEAWKKKMRDISDTFNH